MDIQATIAAANALLHTAGGHVVAVHTLEAAAGKVYIRCAASAVPAIEAAGGVWSHWYGRNCDDKEQRDLRLMVEGVEFSVFETREVTP